MNTSQIASIMSQNAVWVAIIIIIGYIAYFIYKFYKKNKKMFNNIKSKIMKGGLTKNGMDTKEATN